jgi:arginase
MIRSMINRERSAVNLCSISGVIDMNILGAPTNLGNRPYERDGTARWTDRGPARLRELGIVSRLRARDLGDVAAAPYRDFIRPPGGIRNEDLVLEHIGALARSLESQNDFTLVIAGDCSVLPGAIHGLARGREIGLVYIDAHADFNTAEQSETGGVAGMPVALVTGRGDTPLARLGGNGPLVRDENIVAVGVREGDFAGSRILTATTADQVLTRIGSRPFFVHLDVDALDPAIMPFVDSPTPGGLSKGEMTDLLRPLVRHPNAIGMEVTIYDPRDDSDGRGAALLVEILADAFDG